MTSACLKCHSGLTVSSFRLDRNLVSIFHSVLACYTCKLNLKIIIMFVKQSFKKRGVNMLISISTMPAGESVLEYTKEIQNYADFLHCDICDGIYNQKKCFSPEICKEINSISTIPLDCHLMTKDSLQNAKTYIENGANILTAQIESFNDEKNVNEFIDFVKPHNATLVGLSLEPQTNIEKVFPFLTKLDVVLLMSVKSGASGQQFEIQTIKKIKDIREYREQNKLHFLIEVDGGVNAQNASDIKLAGADIVVSGSYVFSSIDKKNAIEKIK